MGTVKIYDKKLGKTIEYYMEGRLKNSLDNKVIPSLQKNDKDCVIVVDGREGSGKSTFALQMAKYVDPSFNLKRIVFAPEDFREAILKAKKGQAIVYDEAFTGFSSRASLSPINRVLVSLAMQMRQKNLFVIIVLPTIFLLDKYMAMFRTRALIHVFESRGNRGYFRLYNSKAKKLLLLLGSKTMSYSPKFVRTNFKGRFYGKFALGSDEIEKQYRKNKEIALAESEKTSMTSAQVKYKEQRNLILYLLRKNTGLTYQELSNLLLDYNLEMSYTQISKICGSFGDTIDNREKKKGTDDNNSDSNAYTDKNSENIDKNDDELIDIPLF